MRRRTRRVALVVGALWALGVIGSVVGGFIDPAAFFRAWLCSYVFWLGVPLAGVTLVLVHDLSGGDWMRTARPALNAAIVTMPLATLAGIPAFVDLDAVYVWTHPAADLANVFYLNPAAFFIRYGFYVILWNLLAAYALLGPRRGGFPIAPALSWISGMGLVALALSASFAAIDWILSLEPKFWSSAFLYAQAASWFNTGMALVLLIVAAVGWPGVQRRAHMADLARILLATTIFWAYIEFIQFLIIWEANLKTEIPWYLKRLEFGMASGDLHRCRARIYRAVPGAAVGAAEAQPRGHSRDLRVHLDQSHCQYMAAGHAGIHPSVADLARRRGLVGPRRCDGVSVRLGLALRSRARECERTNLGGGSCLSCCRIKSEGHCARPGR